MKNFFLTLAPLRVAGQSISSSISLALVIIDVEMVARQFLGLADLARAQISQHQDLALAALQIVAPILKRLNDG